MAAAETCELWSAPASTARASTRTHASLCPRNTVLADVTAQEGDAHVAAHVRQRVVQPVHAELVAVRRLAPSRHPDVTWTNLPHNPPSLPAMVRTVPVRRGEAPGRLEGVERVPARERNRVKPQVGRPPGCPRTPYRLTPPAAS